MENAITANSLSVNLGKKNILKNINLKVPKGVIFGLVGKNGAGKTTLIKTIMNIYTPSAGFIDYNGLKVYEDEVKVKEMLNCVFDDFYVNKNLKPKKMAKLLNIFYKNFDYDFYKKYMDIFGLDENMRIQKCSLGVQKKLNIVLTMATRPQILILDEPTANLDPTSRVQVLDMLLDYMQDENHTVIFSTHITSDLDKVADYVALIDNGEIVFSKDKNKLTDEYTKVMGHTPTIEDIMVQYEEEK